MLGSKKRTLPILLLATALLLPVPLLANCGHCGVGEEAHEAGHEGHQHAAKAPPAPHGGQMASAGGLDFEVVFLPGAIRVYSQAISQPDVKGSAVLIGGEKKVEIPLDFQKAGGWLEGAHDFAALAKGSKLSLELTGLPEKKAAKFDLDFAGLTSAAKAAPAFLCPMHPDVTDDKPSDCPKCGMKLEPPKAK